MICNSKPFRIGTYILLGILVLICIVPFILLISSSFTSEETLALYGYSLIPKDFSLDAYTFLWNVKDSIIRAYCMSFLITAIGVSLNLCLTLLFAYPLSRRDLPGRRFFSFFLFFTMLFNGGFVPTYMVYTNFLHVKDTLAGMIVPYLMMNAFYVIMMRTYISTNVPNEVLEAAKIDGGGEFQILLRIVIPMSRPIISTVALMSLIAYWNNWTNGVYFISNRTELYGIQNYLTAVMNNVLFLQTHMSDVITYKIPSIGIRMAIAVIAIVPVLLVYPFFQKSFVKGITLGSVKG